MSGTRQGGLKAAKKNLENYGDNFYRLIGSKGGRKTGKKGFALNPALASVAGRKGGLKSRRTGVTTGQGKEKEYVWKGEEGDELVFA